MDVAGTVGIHTEHSAVNFPFIGAAEIKPAGLVRTFPLKGPFDSLLLLNGLVHYRHNHTLC